MPDIILLAGPNGAGKSTLAPFLLRDTFELLKYVSANTMDPILPKEPLKIDLSQTSALLVEHVEAIENIFARAVQNALRHHKQIGNPIAVWQDGHVVLIQPQDIPTDEISSVPFPSSEIA